MSKGRGEKVSRICRIVTVAAVCWITDVEFSWAQVPQESYDFSMSKGVAEFTRGHYELAAKMFERAVEVKPRDLDAVNYLGQTYLRLKKYSEAERVFETLAHLEPMSARAWLGIGIARSQQGNYQEALEALAKAEERDPNHPLVYFYQGLVATELKSYDQAPALFSRAMALSPDLTPSARYYTGMSYYQRGLADLARQEFEAAVASGEPESELARSARSLLQLQNVALNTPKQWDVSLSISGQYDSNVVLLPLGTQPPGGATGISKKDDYRMAIYARGEYRAIQTDQWVGGVTYGFYQSLHQKLTGFDVQDHSPSIFLQRQFGRVQARMQYVFDHVRVGQAPYLNSHTIQPLVTIAEGSGHFTQVQFRYQNKDFQDDRFEGNSFRDGKNWLGGITQFAYFAKGAGHVRLGYAFDMDRTGGGSPGIATPGVPSHADWSYKAHRLSAGLGIPSIWTLQPTLAFDYYLQQYDNPNSLSAAGTTIRRDRVFFVTATIARPLTDWLTVAAEYNYTRDQSNIQFFDYSRNIYSLTLSGRF